MKFVVSAPGKVILFGEHAVVYNYPAIAAAIDLRCRVTVTKEKCKNNEFFLNFKDIKDSEVVCLPINLLLDAPSGDCKVHAWSVVYNIFPNLNKETRMQSDIALSTCVFLFLLFRTLEMNFNGNIEQFLDVVGSNQRVTLDILSEIPIGTGLGSSGAFCVALTTAIFIMFKTVQLSHNLQLDALAYNIICTLSQEAESIIHGKSSGLDPAISIHGGLILYQKSQTPPFHSLPASKFQNQADLLLVNSGIVKSTSKAVVYVSDQLNCVNNGQATRQILQDIGRVVDKVVEIIYNDQTSCKVIESIGSLVKENHALLVKLGVSHGVIDEIVEAMRRENICAKLTGSGCGGCLFGLLTTKEHYNGNLAILEFLEKRSFWYKVVPIFVCGVKVDLYEDLI